MQFREYQNVVPVILHDPEPEKLAMKVAILAKQYKIIDLQYSSHSKIVADPRNPAIIKTTEVFSVFILAQVTEEQIKKAQEDLAAKFQSAVKETEEKESK